MRKKKWEIACDDQCCIVIIIIRPASLSESKLNGSRSLNVIFVTVLFILKAPISRPDDYIKTLDHP